MNIGYARVSTEEQNVDLQLQALLDVGCDVIFEDKASGAQRGRPGLRRAIRRCKPGDVLIAWKLDRLGRSLLDLVELVETLSRKDVGLRILTGQGTMIDTTRAEGRLIFGIFAALAEFERALISERTRAGMEAARRRGVQLGRPFKLAPEQVAEAAGLIARGATRRKVAAQLGVNVATLRRALVAQ